MKFLCAVCERFVTLSAYRMEEGVLYVRCPRCGADNRADAPDPLTPSRGLPKQPPTAFASPPGALDKARADAVRSAAELARAEDPFAVPADVCPKCISPRVPLTTGCASCGLVFSQADAATFRPEGALADRWVAVLSHWDDPKAHDHMLSAASAMGELAAVGRLYRLRLVQAPGDPMAQKGRDEVVRMASAALSPERPSGTPMWQVVAAAVLLAMAFFSVTVLIYKTMQAH